MRVSLRFVIAAALVAGALLKRDRHTGCGEARVPRGAVQSNESVEAFAETAFVYDAVSRVNERLTANIDAIDTALTAILAGSIAAALFTFDKSGALQRGPGTSAFILYCGSIIACSFGYFAGFRAGLENRDGIRPRALVADIMDERDETVAGAIKTLVDVSESNMTIRIYKHASAVVAIVLSIAGVAVLAVAHAAVPVVY